MRKITLLLSVAAMMMVVFDVVPIVSAKKHKEDVGGDGVMTSADDYGNDINANSNGAETVTNYENQRLSIKPIANEHSTSEMEPTTEVKQPKQSSKQHNAKLLNKLGMKRVRTADGGTNHHRKRLASQSRSKYAAGGADGKGGSDSQMFIVKLPPHSHFYNDGSPVAVHQKLQHQQHKQHHHLQQQAPYNSLNTVPVGFVSNGKPAKVYHWNLPTIKHAMNSGRFKNGNDAVALQQQQQKHHLLQYNQAGDFELPSVAAGSKIVPRRTLYYKPRASGKPVKKSFVNNGKPNGFYVVSSKTAAAVPQYHKIVKAYYGSGDD